MTITKKLQIPSFTLDWGKNSVMEKSKYDLKRIITVLIHYLRNTVQSIILGYMYDYIGSSLFNHSLVDNLKPEFDIRTNVERELFKI